MPCYARIVLSSTAQVQGHPAKFHVWQGRNLGKLITALSGEREEMTLPQLRMVLTQATAQGLRPTYFVATTRTFAVQSRLFKLMSEMSIARVARVFMTLTCDCDSIENVDYRVCEPNDGTPVTESSDDARKMPI